MSIIDKEDREAIIFLMEAVEKLTLAVLMEDYDGREIHDLHQDAGIYLVDLKNRRDQDE